MLQAPLVTCGKVCTLTAAASTVAELWLEHHCVPAFAFSPLGLRTEFPTTSLDATKDRPNRRLFVTSRDE